MTKDDIEALVRWTWAAAYNTAKTTPKSLDAIDAFSLMEEEMVEQYGHIPRGVAWLNAFTYYCPDDLDI